MIKHPEASSTGEELEAQIADFERRYAGLNMAALAAMAGAMGEGARDQFDLALRRVLSGFHSHLRDAGTATRREMRTDLKAIEARASALLAALNALHYDTWTAMLHGYAQRIPDDFDEDKWAREGLWFADVEWDVVGDSVSRLRDIAAETRLSLPPAPKGRRADGELRAIVTSLARIYQAHSGAPAYAKFSYDRDSGEASSPFMLFVDAVISGFAPEFQRSNNSIAEAIRRTIGNRAAMNGKKG